MLGVAGPSSLRLDLVAPAAPPPGSGGPARSPWAGVSGGNTSTVKSVDGETRRGQQQPELAMLEMEKKWSEWSESQQEASYLVGDPLLPIYRVKWRLLEVG